MGTTTYGDFEWDEDKASRNERKHGISFEEASTVFADPSYLLLPDARAPAVSWRSESPALPACWS